jgi:CheY-like chemotaxis protein
MENLLTEYNKFSDINNHSNHSNTQLGNEDISKDAAKQIHFSGFHDLMGFRVREILLVASSYDSFVLEEDGRLSERIFSEYLDMNLQFIPRMEHVNTAKQAFEKFNEKNYDLVIVMLRMKDMNPLEFGKMIKEKYSDTYVVMLTYEVLNNELKKEIINCHAIDRIFYWSGNDKLMLTIIKHVEDDANAPKDTRQGVQVILLIEDSPLMYSQLMPNIYTQLMKQTQYLISQGVNTLHRLLRMRARPKILLATTYEDAIDLYSRFEHNILGVISDIAFEKDGKIDDEAGFKLAKKISDKDEYLPILLNSDEKINQQKALKKGYRFLYKNSLTLNTELNTYINYYYGFGSFVFRHPDGKQISRSESVEAFEKTIRELPSESLLYHAKRHQFSKWLHARTEFIVAQELRKIEDGFLDSEPMRHEIVESLNRYFSRIVKGKITEFGSAKIDIEDAFIKLGSGSIGGKGRGIAFFNSILSDFKSQNKYDGIKINTPLTFVICSDVFEAFIDTNGLQEMAVETDDEDTINQKFLGAALPDKIIALLKELIDSIDYPIAIRSSSILEDSQMLPFAGIYSTYILPNNHSDTNVRLKQLMDAIRLVYASVFHQSAKKYIKNANVRLEEEKMAILIQKVVGQKHDDIYYPAISGVAQSYNYYPISNLKPQDGIASLALGFGKIVVDGEHGFRFSPAYPKKPPLFASAVQQMKKSQNYFYALGLDHPSIDITADQGKTYKTFDLQRAERDGALKHVGSTYVRKNDMIRDTLSVDGPRVVTFAPILKYARFPLAKLIRDVVALCKDALGSDVEVEFAVNIPDDPNENAKFYLLQIRPMVTGSEFNQVKIDNIKPEKLVCRCNHTTGNGAFDDIYDLIMVDPDTFDISDSNKIATQIGELNLKLYGEKRRYILLTFGRLGTADRWLGIPVEWAQMSQAKVIIEADTDSLQVDPSLGSHFHHNLISLKMGYMHIGKLEGSEFLDWAWINRLPVKQRTKHVKHIRFNAPLMVKIDGREGKGIILKNDI